MKIVRIEMVQMEHNRRVIVVLGMHRSGTSAVTRSLELVGVRLGDVLHPASIDNPKGFWEDRDVLSVNEELLAELGSSYDGLGLLLKDLPATDRIRALHARASDLVSSRCNAAAGIWGFKDPRTARLLPFWQGVFRAVGCEASYIVVVRNPVSVVESLRKRDGFDSVKTLYLWLEHVVPAITETRSAQRVVVDYDRLMEDPIHEILRISDTLALSKPDPSALAAYKSEFLESELRHNVASGSDLAALPDVPRAVLKCQGWLERLAMGAVDVDASEVAVAFDDLAFTLNELKPALSLIARQDQRLKAERFMRERVDALNVSLVDLKVANDWLRQQRDAWERTADEREQSITALQAQLEDLLRGNAWLTSQREAWERSAIDRAQSFSALQTHVQELLSGNAWLASQRDVWEQTAADREQSIAALEAHVQELLSSNAGLASQRDIWERTAADREHSISALQAYVQELLSGNAWLASQRDIWERTAADREHSISALQAYVQELLSGNAWLASQRDAWERTAADCEQLITAIRARHREADEKLVASEAMLKKLRDHWVVRFVNRIGGYNIL
ncbi:Chromosome partition protein Smc [Azoarcus sp. Aa7]|nr:Chromosome partition protein Smc [Azoarcus sp. Aa7]